MIEPDVRIYSNFSELCVAAADLFVELSNRTIQAKGSFYIALSGGSTPRRVYELLAAPEYRDRIRWSKIFFFWGDERFVPNDHPDSNYKMAYDAFLSKVPVPANNIFPVPTQNITPQEAATMYEELIKKHADRFDLVLLGLGEDGHTASLFPHTNALKENSRWVIENYVPKLQSHRITLTAHAINQTAVVVFLVSGKSKARALNEILKGPQDPERLPAQLVQPLSDQLIFLVDRDSADE